MAGFAQRLANNLVECLVEAREMVAPCAYESIGTPSGRSSADLPAHAFTNPACLPMSATTVEPSISMV